MPPRSALKMPGPSPAVALDAVAVNKLLLRAADTSRGATAATESRSTSPA